MQRIEKTVFISYRRTHGPWALAIFQNLTHHGYDVFFDFKRIGRGDFESAIFENIGARAHFLILLTPSALERCDDPQDLFRREIEAALDGNRNIVPLMAEGFDFGSPSIAGKLTGKLALMRRFSALSITVEYFDECMQRLRERHLDVPIEMVLHRPSPAAQQVAKEEQTAANDAPPVDKGDFFTNLLTTGMLMPVRAQVLWWRVRSFFR